MVELEARIKELETELSDTRQLYYEVISQRNAFYVECKRIRETAIKTLDSVWAALCDRLLAKGPLAKLYADSVYKEIRQARDELRESWAKKEPVAGEKE
jgi:hypothetical protein